MRYARRTENFEIYDYYVRNRARARAEADARYRCKAREPGFLSRYRIPTVLLPSSAASPRYHVSSGALWKRKKNQTKK